MFFRSLIAVLVVVLAPSLMAFAQTEAALDAPPEARPHNVILFISDGCGPASFTLARDYLRYQGRPDGLALDSIFVGSIRTFASDSRVTDSAASGTAFACGVKTYNGAIAVDTLQRPVATLLEAAEARGMATGLVATSRITHATPAAFAAHVPSRQQEADIAVQELGSGVDVLFGGGTRYFLPQSLGGSREDDRNLLGEAEEKGYRVVRDRAGFDTLGAAPALALFSRSHMAYEIDRDPATEPSLAEMTAKAIELLDDDPDGFFLMVEGSRIDHAAHGNDAAAHLHDILAYDEAVATALAFAREDGRTLFVSTSDHETGGLSLGRNIDGRGIYAWKPEVLEGVEASLWAMYEAAGDQPPCAVLLRYASITCTEAEEAAFDQIIEDQPRVGLLIAEIISKRAVLGWTTGGHTAVDINLYAYGPGRDHFIGHHDNTAIGNLLAELLAFDLAALTAQLRQEVGSQ